MAVIKKIEEIMNILNVKGYKLGDPVDIDNISYTTKGENEITFINNQKQIGYNTKSKYCHNMQDGLGILLMNVVSIEKPTRIMITKEMDIKIKNVEVIKEILNIFMVKEDM